MTGIHRHCCGRNAAFGCYDSGHTVTPPSRYPGILLEQDNSGTKKTGIQKLCPRLLSCYCCLAAAALFVLPVSTKSRIKFEIFTGSLRNKPVHWALADDKAPRSSVFLFALIASYYAAVLSPVARCESRSMLAALLALIIYPFTRNTRRRIK